MSNKQQEQTLRQRLIAHVMNRVETEMERLAPGEIELLKSMVDTAHEAAPVTLERLPMSVACTLSVLLGEYVYNSAADKKKNEEEDLPRALSRDQYQRQAHQELCLLERETLTSRPCTRLEQLRIMWRRMRWESQ